MHILTWLKWFAPRLSARVKTADLSCAVGIPRVLNVWSTHQFWFGLLKSLGIDPRHIVFSGTTSEETRPRIRPRPRHRRLLLSRQVHVRPLRRTDLRPETQDRHSVFADDPHTTLVPSTGTS